MYGRKIRTPREGPLGFQFVWPLFLCQNDEEKQETSPEMPEKRNKYKCLKKISLSKCSHILDEHSTLHNQSTRGGATNFCWEKFRTGLARLVHFVFRIETTGGFI